MATGWGREDEAEQAHFELAVLGVDADDPSPEGFQELTVNTTRGGIGLRHYGAMQPRGGVVWLGGVGGGWDTPAAGLYPRLGRELVDEQLSSCRVRFRQPTSLPESVLDALVAARFLQETGCERIALVGHSMGGAVAIQAALNNEAVVTIVTLSTQSYGATIASELPSEQSMLLIHGDADDVLPPASSKLVHSVVQGRKRLVVLPGVGHGLDEAADEVAEIVRRWVHTELGGDGAGTMPSSRWTS